MALKSKPYYWVSCDEPDCGNISTEGCEYTAWEDEGQALDQATESDWLTVSHGADGDKHYCDGHAAKHDPELKDEDEDNEQ